MAVSDAYGSKLVPPSAVVTGGAGAIGSRLVRRLIAMGVERVTVVDDLSSGHDWLLPAHDRVTLIERDVCELWDLAIDAKDGWIFHLAAFFANQNSVDHPLDDLHTNGQGTLTTLMWADQQRARRLVYASAGCSIAGHEVEGPINEDLPVSLYLDTPYQVTKALGEFYCNLFSTLSTVRCRFFNSFGPGEVPGQYRNVIPNFIWRALHDQTLPITGTGQETRDFIYVDDLVDGLIAAASRTDADGEAFNLGTGAQTTVEDLARLVIRLCESKSEMEYVPRRSWDHSVHRQADVTKARKVLGFQPSVSMEEGLRRTIRWFRGHEAQIASAGHGLT